MEILFDFHGDSIRISCRFYSKFIETQDAPRTAQEASKRFPDLQKSWEKKPKAIRENLAKPSISIDFSHGFSIVAPNQLPRASTALGRPKGLEALAATALGRMRTVEPFASTALGRMWTMETLASTALYIDALPVHLLRQVSVGRQVGGFLCCSCMF